MTKGVWISDFFTNKKKRNSSRPFWSRLRSREENMDGVGEIRDQGAGEGKQTHSTDRVFPHEIGLDLPPYYSIKRQRASG